MERRYWPWRPYAPRWRNTVPNDGWRPMYNYPNAWAPRQLRPPAGGQLARGPLHPLDNRFPPPPGPVRQSPRRTHGVERNRRPSWGGRPVNKNTAEGASSSAGLVNGRDSHATQSVCYVSDGRQRQVELKVPLLQIPKLFQRPPHATKSSDKMAVSEPPGRGSDKSDAVPSKAENAPKAAPKESKASVPMEAEASNEVVAALSSKAPKANSSNASEDEHAVVVPKPVSVEESQTSEFKHLQANGKAVSESPSRITNAEVNPTVARKTDHLATKSQKVGASPVASSKPMPDSKSSEPPSQVSTAKVNPPSAVAAKKTDHASAKPKKLGASSGLNSKLVPKSEKTKPTSSHASEETAISKPPDHTSKAKARLPHVAARDTDSAASAKPNVPSVTDSKPVPIKVLQAQGKTVPPQAGKMVLPNQAPKARTLVRAPTKAKASLVTASKPIPVRVSQPGEPALPQVPSEPDSKPIPVWVSQGNVQACPGSSTCCKPASSQKKHSTGDEPYEDVSDVPLEEYCDDPSDEVSQVEQGVVLGEGKEEPQQPSCDKGKATQLSDCKDVPDMPLTMYHSPKKSDNPFQPVRRHAGEGVPKRPLGKKKVVGVKKAEEQKCTKVVEACHLLDQAAAKPTLVATNKVKALLGMKQSAAKLTATAAPSNGKHGGAAKRQFEWPGSARQDVKKRKFDMSSEKSKPEPCPSSIRQNGSPSPGKLAVKKIKKVVSATKISANPSVAGTNNEGTPKDSPVAVLSTTQQNGSLLPPKKLAAKKIEKEETCSKASAKPSTASVNNKETSKDPPVVAPKLEASNEVVAKNKKSEPTSAKTDSGHSSVTTPTHKKDSAKRKSTPPKKAPMAKSGKSTLPGKAAAMKLNKSPSTKAKGKTNGLPMTESSTNPQAQTEAPEKKQPQPPSSRATVKTHTPSLEGTSTKACKSSSCSGSSVVPAKHRDMSKAAETLSGKDYPAQKPRCLGSAEAALVCASPTSDEFPGSSLKQCHSSKTKESSSEATKAHKSFSGPAPMPRKREVEAKGTPSVVADGQPRDNTSQKPAGSVEEQKTTPVEKRCLEVSKGSQSCDTLQASGIQKKAKPATIVNVSRTEGDAKNSDAAKKIEDRCDNSSMSNVAPERNYSGAELPPSGGVVKTKHPVTKTTDKAAKTTTVKEALSKPTSGSAVKTKHPASGTVNTAAEATTAEDALSKPISGSAVKTKHLDSGIVGKAVKHATDKEVLGTPLNDATCSSLSQEPQSMSVLQPTDEDATLPSEENMVKDQAEGLAKSKTAAASPHEGEGPKQAREPSVVLSPSCDVPVLQEADHINGMLPHGSNSQKSPADDATLVNRNCESLAMSTGMTTLISPSQERACLTQQSDDSSASVIGQVSSAEHPRRKSLVPPELPAGAKTAKQGDGNESPSACDNVSAEKPVVGAHSLRKPLPSEDADKRHDSTASTEDHDGQTGEESSPSPSQQREGDCSMSTLRSNSGEQDTCATLSQGDAGACKPDADAEGPATSVHQDSVIKQSPLKKKNKNKGPGTNTSLRSSWVFSRKKRGKRQRCSTETPSGSSLKKLKAADSSQGSSSSELSVSPTAIKKEPEDDIETEATSLLAAPPGQARRSRDPKSAGNSTKKFKAAAPSEYMDLVAQGSSSEFTGEPSASRVKKEPGGDVDTEAEQLFNEPRTPRTLRRLVSPGVQASDRSPKRARSAKSPAAGSKPLDPSSSSNTASAAVPLTPLETAQMDLDMFTGLSILDVCGSGAEKLVELKERLQVHSIGKEEALDVVQKAVHKAVLDEYFKREHAIRTLKLLAKIPFSLDHTKVAKIRQLTRAIVATSEAGSKP